MRDRALRRALRAGTAVLAAWAAVSGAGCGPRVATVYEKVIGSRSYEGTTRSLTRTREVHDGLETRFIFSATWLSPAWAQAFSAEYANIYYLDNTRTGQVTARWRGESEKYERFLVSLFTPDDRLNDLEKAGSSWSLRLVGADEKDYAPVYVRRTELRGEELSRFFPSVGPWSRAYEVAFPKAGGEGTPPAKAESPRLKLVLTGVQGRAVLSWD